MEQRKTKNKEVGTKMRKGNRSVMRAALMSALVGILSVGLPAAHAEVDLKEVADKLTIGAEVRNRYETLDNYDFNDAVLDENSRIFLRTRVRMKFDATPDITAFVEVQDSRRWGDETSTASDDAGVDLHQGYGEVRNILGFPVDIRVGRQELSYGSERLIGAFGWSNTGRSFDADKITVHLNSFDVELFGAIVSDEARSDNDHTLWGIVGKYTGSKTLKFQPYLFFDRDGRDSYVDEGGNAGKLKEYTAGAWLFWDVNDRFRIDLEGAKQFGDRGNDDISAWAGHLGARYTFPSSTWKWEISGEGNIASGDVNPTDRTLETFDLNNNYPTNHNKYGYADLFAWKNMEDYRAGIAFHPFARTRVSVDYHYLRLNELNDAWYRANGMVLNGLVGGTFTGNRKMGDEVDLLIKHKYNDHLDFLGGWSVFLPDKVLPATGTSDNANFFYLQSRYRF